MQEPKEAHHQIQIETRHQSIRKVMTHDFKKTQPPSALPLALLTRKSDINNETPK